MRAAVLNSGRIHVRDDVSEPRPAAGQVLVQVKAGGICGSDLHFAKHGARMLELGRQMVESTGSADLDLDLNLDRDVYLGHEFAAEVLEFGPHAESPIRAGALVTSMPVLLPTDPLLPETSVQPIVYSNTVKGGYGERMVLSAPLLHEVPNGLPAHLAALTEPVAVGIHAVNKSGIKPGDGALVFGCGPVGLATIAALKLRGIGPIVAADFSPTRRALAETTGADETVDPATESGWSAWARVGGDRPLVVFEAVGVPGILNEIMRYAPLRSRIVVIGVCMEDDTVNPYFGISKELAVQFAVAYEPSEFTEALHAIAEGAITVEPMVTSRVTLDGVPGAFESLADPDEQCKIIWEP